MSTPTLKLARLGDGPEIFHTLQGEGVTVGRPAVFLRTSLCNLHCRWCDTDYTWNWVGTPWPHDRDAEPGYAKFRREDEIIEVTVGEAARRILDFACPRVVFTGGEPLLQQEALEGLATALCTAMPGVALEVETNGTLAPEEALAEQVSQFNVSPKLANSGNPAESRRRTGVLRAFLATGRAWFKFVIAGAEDVQEVLDLVRGVPLPADRVLLMPEGRTAEAVAAHRGLAVQLCLEHGFTFTDRLHLRLFGARRGT